MKKIIKKIIQLIKKYRRILLLIGILIIVSLLIYYLITRDRKMVCTLSSTQTQDNYTYDSKYTIIHNKIVKEVTMEETITSTDKTVLEHYEDSWKKQYEYNVKTYGGYTYKIKQEKDKVTSNVVIDYKTMNVGKYIRFNNAMKEYSNGKDEITTEGMKTMLEKRGFVCK